MLIRLSCGDWIDPARVAIVKIIQPGKVKIDTETTIYAPGSVELLYRDGSGLSLTIKDEGDIKLDDVAREVATQINEALQGEVPRETTG